MKNNMKDIHCIFCRMEQSKPCDFNIAINY